MDAETEKSKKVKIKVYAGSHQRALRKGSQLVLTLARAPPKKCRDTIWLQWGVTFSQVVWLIGC
jgi:hypothetical protein